MVTIGRNPNTGEIEFFDDPQLAKARGYVDIEQAVPSGDGDGEAEVVANTGVPTASAGLTDLQNAEKIALDIINEFLKNFEGSNIYSSDDDDDEDDAEFEEETQVYTPTKADAAALYP